MKHSYAAKIIRQKGFQILSKGKKILTQPYNMHHDALITIIPKNTDFIKGFTGALPLEKITEIAELESRFKFRVLRYKGSDAFSYQKYGYKLVRHTHPGTNIMSRMPQGHCVMFDPINRAIALFGKNTTITGQTAWINIDERPETMLKPPEANPRNFKSYLNSASKKLAKMVSFESKINVFTIPESLLGVVSEGLMICMPEPETKNMPFILVLGSKGTGKSMGMSSLTCGYYHKGDAMVININDINGETHTRCMEWDDNMFRKDLYRFGEPSVPMPAVYFYPSTKEKYEKVYSDEVSFDISLPYRNVLADQNLFKYNKEWQMAEGKSGAKWKELIWKDGKVRQDGLLSVKNMEDAERVLDKVTDGNMRRKMSTVLNSIWNSQILDVTTGKPSHWIAKAGAREFPEFPPNIAMMAGATPYIITEAIRDEPWYPMWLRFMIRNILKFARKVKKPIFIESDEVAEIMKEPATRHIIEQGIRECRKAGVGFGIVSHSLLDVPDQIITHADYVLVYRTTEIDSDLTKLLKKLGMTQRQINELPQLEQFQCYACGSFVFYDNNGRRTEKRGAFKIVKMKPPNCRHYGGK